MMNRNFAHHGPFANLVAGVSIFAPFLGGAVGPGGGLIGGIVGGAAKGWLEGDDTAGIVRYAIEGALGGLVGGLVGAKGAAAAKATAPLVKALSKGGTANAGFMLATGGPGPFGWGPARVDSVSHGVLPTVSIGRGDRPDG